MLEIESVNGHDGLRHVLAEVNDGGEDEGDHVRHGALSVDAHHLTLRPLSLVPRVGVASVGRPSERGLASQRVGLGPRGHEHQDQRDAENAEAGVRRVGEGAHVVDHVLERADRPGHRGDVCRGGEGR